MITEYIGENHYPVNFRVVDKSENKTKNDYFLEMFAELLSWIVLFYFALLKFQPLYDMIKVVLRDANQTFRLRVITCIN
jgi:hypothetical protein